MGCWCSGISNASRSAATDRVMCWAMYCTLEGGGIEVEEGEAAVEGYMEQADGELDGEGMEQLARDFPNYEA